MRAHQGFFFNLENFAGSSRKIVTALSKQTQVELKLPRTKLVLLYSFGYDGLARRLPRSISAGAMPPVTVTVPTFDPHDERNLLKRDSTMPVAIEMILVPWFRTKIVVCHTLARWYTYTCGTVDVEIVDYVIFVRPP